MNETAQSPIERLTGEMSSLEGNITYLQARITKIVETLLGETSGPPPLDKATETQGQIGVCFTLLTNMQIDLEAINFQLNRLDPEELDKPKPA